MEMHELIAACRRILDVADRDIYTDAPECAEQVEDVFDALAGLRQVLHKGGIEA